MQDRRDEGHEGYRTGVIRTGGMPEGGNQERWDAGQAGCRTGGMQDRRDTGKEGYRTGGM